MTYTSISKEKAAEQEDTNMKKAYAFLLTIGLIFLLEDCSAQGQKEGGKARMELEPSGRQVEKFDFEQKGIEEWKTVAGKWTVKEVAGAPNGKRVLVLRPQGSDFNVIVAPGGPYSDVDVSVRFMPISGKEDASGGIVFRFSEGRYYVVRANALENNFRLYYYDNGRRQLATATVQPPALGQWQTLQVVAVADHIRAYLNGKLLLDHRDSRFRSGQVGLWTKADSVTAFDDLEIKGHKSQ
jgi:3-keto-disaccharide hydrolase